MRDWAKYRKMGFWKFVLFRITGWVMVYFFYYLFGFWVIEQIVRGPNRFLSWMHIYIGAPFFLVFGFILGVFLWLTKVSRIRSDEKTDET